MPTPPLTGTATRTDPARPAKPAAPQRLTSDVARRLGATFGALHRPRSVAVGRGHGRRPATRAAALIDGLLSAGVDVIDLGPCAAEVVAFSVSHLADAEVDAAIQVTSHPDPTLTTGLRLTLPPSQWPAGADTEVLLADVSAEDVTVPGATRGRHQHDDLSDAYVDQLLSLIDVSDLEGMRLVANASFGEASPLLERLIDRLPVHLVPIEREAETELVMRARHPWHPEDRVATSVAVRRMKADLGAAWDADTERVVFFDENGEVVRGGYAVSLLAADALERQQGGTVVHCPRLTWGPDEVIAQAKGRAARCATGPTAVRAAMVAHAACYGGEASGAHWFADAVDAPSGMLAWLRLCALVGRRGRPLSQLVGRLWERHPASGEISRTLADPEGALGLLRLRFEHEANAVCELDGLGLELDGWRLHARCSRSASVLRIQLESRLDAARLTRRTDEVLSVLDHA